jgi:hypothetical protein
MRVETGNVDDNKAQELMRYIDFCLNKSKPLS